MNLFELHTTGAKFSKGTEEYCLFRRARELTSLSFRVTVAVELLLAAASAAMVVLQAGNTGLMVFFALAAVVLVWHVVGELQGKDTRNYIKKARQQVLTPEDAVKELVVAFDETGCTFSAPGSTLPGREVEEQRLFSYGDIGGLFESEDYMLVACKKAGSVCFAKADLTVGAGADALRALLEEKSGRKTIHYELKTERFRKLLG